MRAGVLPPSTEFAMSFWSAKLKIWRVAVLFALVTAILIGGLLIYHRVTRPIYYNLDFGMTMNEVKDIMGEPQRIEFDDGERVQWLYSCEGTPRPSLQLQFYDGRLVGTGEEKWLPWSYDREEEREIGVWTEAISANPRDRLAYLKRGSAREAHSSAALRERDPERAAKELELAIADYSEAIRLDPKHPKAYRCRGSAWHQSGQWDKAIADFSEAIRLAPKSPGGYLGRAAAYEDKGDGDAAKADREKARELDPR
jgi:tetratricopeptide (TPR) repeat protein